MRVWFSFIVFTVLYFSSRGLLVEELGKTFDIFALVFIRGLSFLYLLADLFKNGKRSLSKFRYCIVVLLSITFLSHLFNGTSISQLSTFFLLVFYPLGICLIIINELDSLDIKRIIKIVLLWSLSQFMFSLISNFDIIVSGKLIVDDPFNGFFGYPRAYHFSFFALSVVAILIVSSKNRIKKEHYYYLILLLTPVLAGAGRIVFALLFSVVIAFILKANSASFSKKVIYITLCSCIFIFFQAYVGYYEPTQAAFNDIISNPLKNPKILYFISSFSPFISEPLNLVFGNGPGNYMSSAAMQFRPDLVRVFNEDIHEAYSVDIYQAFNNIIGFIGDVGILFFIIYFYMAFIIVNAINKNLENQDSFKTMIVKVFVILTITLATLFHVFDDPYYSLTFWFAIALIYKVSLRFNRLKKIELWQKAILYEDLTRLRKVV